MAEETTLTLPTIEDLRGSDAQDRGVDHLEIDADDLEYPISEKPLSAAQESTPSPSPTLPQRRDELLMENVGETLLEVLETRGARVPRESLLAQHQRLLAGQFERRTIRTRTSSGVTVTLGPGGGSRSARPVAYLARNAIVYDPAYEVEGEFAARLSQRLDEVPLPIPNEVLEEYSLDPTAIEVVDTNTFDTAVVFRDESDYYYRGGEPRDGWVGKLDMAVDSVEQAQEEALKPDPVIAAEQVGRDVVRQGDWFFVETEAKPSGIIRRPELDYPEEDDQLGNHIAEWQGIQIDHPPRIFVKGEVRHVDGDHESIHFNSWREAINNGIDARSFEVPQRETVDRIGEMQSSRRGHTRTGTGSSTRVQYD